MSKSQNTKNEQQKDLCITSEQLTEQWKKGELLEGWYWVKIKTWCECIDRLYYTSDIFLDGDVPVDNDKITEVLAKVPDYEEWKQLKEQINKCYLDAINRGTANTVKAVKEFGMPERIKQLVEQNVQLKELLKECREPLEVLAEKRNACDWCPENLLAKIDEVLK